MVFSTRTPGPRRFGAGALVLDRVRLAATGKVVCAHLPHGTHQIELVVQVVLAALGVYLVAGLRARRSSR